MSNVRFDTIELATLGFSLHRLDGRAMAPFRSDSVVIPGRNRRGDLSTEYDIKGITLQGKLSADLTFANHNKANWLARLDALKETLLPVKGFRKLVISGDQPSRWRWARYADMDLTEERPIFRLPFVPVSIQFDVLEPFWREVASQQFVAIDDTWVPNDGHEDTLPKVTVLFDGNIHSTPAAFGNTPVTLFEIDDLQVIWRGDDIEGSRIDATDRLIIDSETLTVRQQDGGTGAGRDVIRYYDYSGPGAYRASGFPVIKRGGSVVNSIHPSVQYILFEYETLYT